MGAAQGWWIAQLWLLFAGCPHRVDFVVGLLECICWTLVWIFLPWGSHCWAPGCSHLHLQVKHVNIVHKTHAAVCCVKDNSRVTLLSVTILPQGGPQICLAPGPQKVNSALLPGAESQVQPAPWHQRCRSRHRGVSEGQDPNFQRRQDPPKTPQMPPPPDNLLSCDRP